jgi:hypothetical protein
MHTVPARPVAVAARVGCNKRSALHRILMRKTSGAMPVGYCALPAEMKNPSTLEADGFMGMPDN